jgi:predicted metal-dependent HD superfamily phosphohydrolase
MLLRNKWRHLLKSFKVDEKIINQTWSELVTAYSSEGRYYHNLKHIQEVLQIVDKLDESSLKLAAWFHDIIYDTQRHDNEEKSAEYASDLLSLLNIPDLIINNTCRLILTTKHHQVEVNDLDQVLIDADLAILGSNRKRYSEYMQAIRFEYIWVPEQEYITARKRVLTSFLERAYIFHTPELFSQLEATARQNIEGEIMLLNSRLK